MTIAHFLDDRARGVVAADALLVATADRARERADVNAVSFLNEDALAAARRGPGSGLLAGVPVLVKDNIDTADAPTTAGTPGLRGRVPPADAPIITALRRAGAVIAGKCTQHELALGASSVNPFSGTPRNPLDPARTAGGSSGGAAAAVAAGITPAAIGTDTHGSVRIPAAFCGLFGFRPTVGRYPTAGVVPVSPTRDTPGVITAGIADLMLMDAAITGAAPTPQPPLPAGELRLGLDPTHLSDIDTDVADAFGAALAGLRAAGATLVELDLADTERRGDEAGQIISLCEFVPSLTGYLAERYPDLSVAAVLDAVASPDVREFVSFMRETIVDDAAYGEALAERAAVREQLRETMCAAGVGAVIHPTTPCLPDLLDVLAGDATAGGPMPGYLRYLRFTSLAGAVGLPAVTVPVRRERGALPVGVELRGATGDDDALLRVASCVAATVSR